MSDRQAIKEMHRQTDRQATMREVSKRRRDGSKQAGRQTDGRTTKDVIREAGKQVGRAAK